MIEASPSPGRRPACPAMGQYELVGFSLIGATSVCRSLGGNRQEVWAEAANTVAGTAGYCGGHPGMATGRIRDRPPRPIRDRATPCAESGRNTRRSLPRAGAALHVRIGQAGLRPILAGTSWPPTPGFFRITTSDV
jgi:hypothetical protein